jgi:hypothetical protein
VEFRKTLSKSRCCIIIEAMVPGQMLLPAYEEHFNTYKNSKIKVMSPKPFMF